MTTPGFTEWTQSAIDALLALGQAVLEAREEIAADEAAVKDAAEANRRRDKLDLFYRDLTWKFAGDWTAALPFVTHVYDDPDTESWKLSQASSGSWEVTINFPGLRPFDAVCSKSFLTFRVFAPVVDRENGDIAWIPVSTKDDVKDLPEAMALAKRYQDQLPARETELAEFLQQRARNLEDHQAAEQKRQVEEEERWTHYRNSVTALESASVYTGSSTVSKGDRATIYALIGIAEAILDHNTRKSTVEPDVTFW